MLREEYRQKLDSIVSQMEQNGESEQDIQFVVNDFKQKYSSTGGTPSTSTKTTKQVKKSTNPIMASQVVQDASNKWTSQNSDKKPTFVGGLLRDIGREVIARPLVTAGLIPGSSTKYGAAQPVENKYFGTIKPFGEAMWKIQRQQDAGDFSATPKEIMSSSVKAGLEGVGAGLNIGSTVATGGGTGIAKTATKQFLTNPGFRTLFNVAVKGTKSAALPSAIAGAGVTLSDIGGTEDVDFLDVVTSVGKGIGTFGIGTVGGGVLSGVGAAGTRAVQKAGSKLGIKSAQEAQAGFQQAKMETQVPEFKKNLSTFVKEFVDKPKLTDKLEKNEDVILNKFVEKNPEIKIKGSRLNTKPAIESAQKDIETLKNSFLSYADEIPTLKTQDDILATANSIVDELEATGVTSVGGDKPELIKQKMQQILSNSFKKSPTKNFKKLDLDASSFYDSARGADELKDTVSGEAYSILAKAIRDTIKNELPDDVAKASYKELQDLIIYKGFLNTLNNKTVAGSKVVSALGRGLGWITGMNTGGGFAAATVGGEVGSDAAKVLSRMPFYSLKRQQKIISKYRNNNPELATKIDDLVEQLQQARNSRLALPAPYGSSAPIKVGLQEPQNLAMPIQRELNTLPVYDYTIPQHQEIVRKAMADVQEFPYRYKQIFSDAVEQLQQAKDNKQMLTDVISEARDEIYKDVKKRLPIISQLTDEDDIVDELVNSGIDEGVALSEVDTILKLNKTGTTKGYTALVKDMAEETANVNIKSSAVLEQLNNQ